MSLHWPRQGLAGYNVYVSRVGLTPVGAACLSKGRSRQPASESRAGVLIQRIRL